jgi:hypothetical protein
MARAGGGLAALLYAPCKVRTVVSGVPILVTQTTGYPFQDAVAITVRPDLPVHFPLALRVPGWANGVAVSINGASVQAQPEGGFVTIARTWMAADRIDISFDIDTRRRTTAAGHSVVEHGALLYVLPIGENWKKWRPHGPTADWQVYPMDAWNYGLSAGTALRRVERPLGAVPFSRRDPAAVVTVVGRPVPEWVEAHGGYAEPPPVQPAVAGDDARTLSLIPYGAAKLRVTVFPTLKSP